MDTMNKFAKPHPCARPSDYGVTTKIKFFTINVMLVGLVATSNLAWSSDDEPALSSHIIKITAVGYGAASSNDNYTPGQKKLMAMRTSKLDAYRALAEQVQGVRVNGNSTVAAMMSQNDSFRVYVDAYLRGAQLIAVTPMADGNYETTMELNLDDRFFGRFAQPNSAGNRGSTNYGNSFGSGHNNFNYNF